MPEELHSCDLCSEQHPESEMHTFSIWQYDVEINYQAGKACVFKMWIDAADADILRSQILTLTHQRNTYRQGYENLLAEIKTRSGS